MKSVARKVHSQKTEKKSQRDKSQNTLVKWVQGEDYFMKHQKMKLGGTKNNNLDTPEVSKRIMKEPQLSYYNSKSSSHKNTKKQFKEIKDKQTNKKKKESKQKVKSKKEKTNLGAYH